MTPLVPKKTTVTKTGQLFEELSDLLLSALEFLGADSGWIGVQEAGGGLTYPVRCGAFSENWLPWQPDHGGVWGFAVGGEPTLLNEVQPWSKLITPPLRNLLSCPLIQNDVILGHVALANKPHGFTAQDAVILQGLAHHMARLLGRKVLLPRAPIELPTPWQRILDRAEEGVLVLDEAGTLIYSNTTWLKWTGLQADELLGRTAPFPFWVSQKDLVQALSQAGTVPANLLPFRRRDGSLFWCRLETVTEHWDIHAVTVAFLRTTPEPSRPASNGESSPVQLPAEHPAALQPPAPDWLPLLLDLDDSIEGWCVAWEERTGLSATDVEGSRCELVLDWLFPQQHDRDRVADCFHQPHTTGFQLVLELAAVSGSRPTLCTFLALPEAGSVLSRRWLLLVTESEQVADPGKNQGSSHLDPAQTADTAPSPSPPVTPPDIKETRP